MMPSYFCKILDFSKKFILPLIGLLLWELVPTYVMGTIPDAELDSFTLRNTEKRFGPAARDKKVIVADENDTFQTALARTQQPIGEDLERVGIVVTFGGNIKDRTEQITRLNTLGIPVTIFMTTSQITPDHLESVSHYTPNQLRLCLTLESKQDEKYTVAYPM